MRKILHSDCNSFYASVECLYRPEIRDKPVAVGGDPENRHGIILTKNDIAKKCGVKTAQPIWQAKQACPELVVVPPNFQLYTRFSKMAREIYLDYTSRVEPFGLDEAWLDVTGNVGFNDNGFTVAKQISQRIKKELGITVSIGVSYNKVFAKLGSDYKKPDAITQITKENFKQIAWPLPANDMLYVGRSTMKTLSTMGIYTIGELANTPVMLLRKQFGKWGDVLYSFSNGYDSSPVKEYNEASEIKSVGNSTTSPKDLISDHDVNIVMSVLCDSVGRRLRSLGVEGRTISISVRDCRLISFTRQRKIKNSTNVTSEIRRHSMELLRESYDWSNPIRSIGVTVSDLTESNSYDQLNIFESPDKKEKMQKLDNTVDSLKDRFGSYVIRPGSMLLDSKLSGFDPIREHTIHPVGYF